jgi:hypothetical protein
LLVQHRVVITEETHDVPILDFGVPHFNVIGITLMMMAAVIFSEEKVFGFVDSS